MKTTFVTLASFLAFASVNALPASQGPAASAEKSVAAVSSASAPSPSLAVDSQKVDNRLDASIGEILDKTLELIENLLDYVAGIVGDDSLINLDVTSIDELIAEILALLDLDTIVPPVSPPGVPLSEKAADVMQSFVSNMRMGHSGMDAANNQPLKVVAAALDLYSQIPQEKRAMPKASA